ncbi:hypothetical protein, partial [Undibacterium luofuense]
LCHHRCGNCCGQGQYGGSQECGETVFHYGASFKQNKVGSAYWNVLRHQQGDALCVTGVPARQVLPSIVVRWTKYLTQSGAPVTCNPKGTSLTNKVRRFDAQVRTP